MAHDPTAPRARLAGAGGGRARRGRSRRGQSTAATTATTSEHGQEPAAPRSARALLAPCLAACSRLVRLMVLTKTTGIRPAQTDSSNTAASGASSWNMSIVRMRAGEGQADGRAQQRAGQHRPQRRPRPAAPAAGCRRRSQTVIGCSATGSRNVSKSQGAAAGPRATVMAARTQRRRPGPSRSPPAASAQPCGRACRRTPAAASTGSRPASARWPATAMHGVARSGRACHSGDDDDQLAPEARRAAGCRRWRAWPTTEVRPGDRHARPQSRPGGPCRVVPDCCSTAAALTNSSVLKIAWLKRWKTAPASAQRRAGAQAQDDVADLADARVGQHPLESLCPRAAERPDHDRERAHRQQHAA